MRWVALAGILCALSAPAQDDKKIRDLLDRLGDDDPQVRDTTQQELVHIGESAIPILKETVKSTSDAEVRNRCQTILKDIDRNIKLAKVYHEPKRVTLKVTKQKLSDVLTTLEQKLDLRIVPPKDENVGVSLEVADAPLLQVLDAIATQIKKSYRIVDEHQIGFNEDSFVPAPTSYVGAFKVRMTRLEKRVINTFDKKSAEVHFNLQATWEKSIKPLEGYALDILEVLDGGGNRLKGNDAAALGWTKNPPMVVIQNPQAGPTEYPFSYIGLDPKISKLKRVLIKGTFRFPLDLKEVRFENPANNQEHDIGGFKIRLASVDRSYIALNVATTADGLMERLYELMDDQSFIATDKDGNEHKCTLSPSGMLDPKTMQYYVMLENQVRQKGLKAFKFNFREVHHMPFQFELTDLELP